jgi:DNA-binding NtrC family response regulator
VNAPTRRKDVLLVDDDRAVLNLVQQWLTSAGYAVVAYDQFEMAKRHLTTTVPDVLITDVRLGAFNGLQLVILAKQQGPLVAAWVMSAFDDPTLRKEAVQSGAGYLNKPCTREQVLAAVHDAMSAMPALPANI